MCKERLSLLLSCSLLWLLVLGQCHQGRISRRSTSAGVWLCSGVHVSKALLQPGSGSSSAEGNAPLAQYGHMSSCPAGSPWVGEWPDTFNSKTLACAPQHSASLYGCWGDLLVFHTSIQGYRHCQSLSCIGTKWAVDLKDKRSWLYLPRRAAAFNNYPMSLRLSALAVLLSCPSPSALSHPPDTGGTGSADQHQEHEKPGNCCWCGSLG